MLSKIRHTWLFAAALLLLMAPACVGVVDDEPLDDEDPVIVDPTVTDAAPGLVLDFTATWCVNCPRMGDAIEAASRERPGKIFPVAVHFRDDYSFAGGEKLCSDFGVAAYPSLIVNLDPSTLITATAKELILAKLDATAKGRKAPCTIAGAVSGTSLTLDVTAEEAGSYSLGVLLLEDGIVAPQTGATGDYVHDNVLRAILSEADISGDTLGSLEKGASARKTYSFETPALSGTGYRILAYTTEDGGLVNNVISLAL